MPCYQVTLDSSLLISSIYSDSAVCLKWSISTSLSFPIASVLGRPSPLLAKTAVRVSCPLFFSLQFLPLFNLSITRHLKWFCLSQSLSLENPSKSLHCFQHEIEASPLWPDFCFPFGLISCHLQTSWKQRLSTLNCMRFLKSAGLCSAFYEWSVA